MSMVILSPVDFKFDTNLPMQLQGILDPQEYAQSIRRCNAAYSAGSILLPRLLMFAGFVIMMIMIIVQVSSPMNGAPVNIFIGMAITFSCVFLGVIWMRYVHNQRISGLQQVISQENNFYQAQAAERQTLQTGWSMIIQQSYEFTGRRTYIYRVCQIRIDIAGGMAALGGLIQTVQPVAPLRVGVRGSAVIGASSGVAGAPTVVITNPYSGATVALSRNQYGGVNVGGANAYGGAFGMQQIPPGAYGYQQQMIMQQQQAALAAAQAPYLAQYQMQQQQQAQQQAQQQQPPQYQQQQQYQQVPPPQYQGEPHHMQNRGGEGEASAPPASLPNDTGDLRSPLLGGK